MHAWRHLQRDVPLFPIINLLSFAFHQQTRVRSIFRTIIIISFSNAPRIFKKSDTKLLCSSSGRRSQPLSVLGWSAFRFSVFGFRAKRCMFSVISSPRSSHHFSTWDSVFLHVDPYYACEKSRNLSLNACTNRAEFWSCQVFGGNNPHV